MAFSWPAFLLLLFLIPIAVAAYVWSLRKRARFAVRYSTLALVRGALPRGAWVRRHLPFGLLMAGLAGLTFAVARPMATVTVPAAQATIILAIDVSGSMCSTDIQPTRIQAAEAAAMGFIHEQNPGTRIGIVAFAGFAELVQPPTTDQQALQAAVESLLTGRGTAIGSAILKSIDAIAEVDKTVAPSAWDASAYTPAPVVPRHAYVPDIVVLLTDGSNNTGPLPFDAAQQAIERGVRVYTIGFGTPNGSQYASCQSSDPSGLGGSGGFNGFLGGRPSAPPVVDSAALKSIADMTGGAYYPAASARILEDVFSRLPTAELTKQEDMEVGAVFTAASAFFVALALLLSMLWRPLP